MNNIFFQKVKRRIAHYLFHRNLKKMDYWYYRSLQQYILPHPPSVYILYTPEEIAQMEKESIERAKKLIDELE